MFEGTQALYPTSHNCHGEFFNIKILWWQCKTTEVLHRECCTVNIWYIPLRRATFLLLNVH